MSGAVSSTHRSATPDTWPHLDEGEREAGTHCEADGGVGLCARASSRLPGALSLLGLCIVPSVGRPASLAFSCVFWARGFYVAFQSGGSSSCENQTLTSFENLSLPSDSSCMAAIFLCLPAKRLLSQSHQLHSQCLGLSKANLTPRLRPKAREKSLREGMAGGRWLLPAADPLPPPPCSLRDCHRNRQRRRNQRERLAHLGRQEEQIQGIPCGKFFQTAGLSEVRRRILNGMGVGRASQRPSLRGLQMTTYYVIPLEVLSHIPTQNFLPLCSGRPLAVSTLSPFYQNVCQPELQDLLAHSSCHMK